MKKKKGALDTSPGALSRFGVSLGMLLRTRMGITVRVIGVRSDPSASLANLNNNYNGTTRAPNHASYNASSYLMGDR